MKNEKKKMIKMMGYHNGRPFLGIILTRENITKLQNDEPIHFHVEEMGIPSINVKEIIVTFFETLEDAIKFYEERGYLDDVSVKQYHPSKH